jgi:hypothetical protein
MRKTLLLALFLCAAQTLRADDVPASEAYSHVGETATVCGEVTGVHYAANSKGKPTFINFDKPYPTQDFTVMIWDDDRAGFSNLEKYAGAKSALTGQSPCIAASRRWCSAIRKRCRPSNPITGRWKRLIEHGRKPRWT